MSQEHVWKVLHLVARKLDLLSEIQKEQINQIRRLIQGIEEHNRLWRELTKEEKNKRKRRKTRKNQPEKTYIS